MLNPNYTKRKIEAGHYEVLDSTGVTVAHIRRTGSSPWDWFLETLIPGESVSGSEDTMAGAIETVTAILDAQPKPPKLYIV